MPKIMNLLFYCRATAKEGVIASLKHGASLAKISAWDARQINQGLIYVTPDISDSYVPQMLNLQATGAINLKKGVLHRPRSCGTDAIPRKTQTPHIYWPSDLP